MVNEHVIMNTPSINRECSSEVSRYSIDQIMLGLAEVWSESVGCYAPFDSATRIDEYLKKSDDWNELDLCDVKYAIEEFFTCEIPDNEWSDFMGEGTLLKEWEERHGPQFTFGTLAELIAKHAVVKRLQPLVILGRPCVTAGAFRLIQSVVRKRRKRTRPFAPSTPVLDRLRGGRLRSVWGKLRFLCEGAIPPLRLTWPERVDRCVWAWPCHIINGILFLVLMIAWHTGREPGEKGSSWWFALLLWPLAVSCVCSFLDRFTNPLPDGIHTFRDLARRLGTESRDPSTTSAV